MANPPNQRWAGDRLGLTESGSGSLAKMPRRIIAILIDWFAARLISYAFFGDDNFATVTIFAIMQIALTATIGNSFGHRIAGLRLISLKRGPNIGLRAALLRAALICVVIPVAIWDADNRGLHDKAAGTVLVRR